MGDYSLQAYGGYRVFRRPRSEGAIEEVYRGSRMEPENAWKEKVQNSGQVPRPSQKRKKSKDLDSS